MRLEQADLSSGIHKVKLTGPLDIAGAGEIEMPFSLIAGKHNKVIIDFKDVTFLASIGIRVLVKAARAISARKGCLVVFNVSEDARKVMRSTGVDSIIAVVSDEGAAVKTCGG